MDANLQTSRIIAASLPMGVVAFWTVAWFMTEGGSSGWSPDALPGAVALGIWVAAAFAGFAAALLMLRRATEGAGGPAVMSGLIIAWAALEGPALLAGVLFLLLGDVRLLVAAGAVYLVGVALTFPRAGWFAERRSR